MTCSRMSHVGTMWTLHVVHGKSTGKLQAIHPHGGGGERIGSMITGYEMVKRLRKGRVLDPVDPRSHVLLEGLGFQHAVGTQSHNAEIFLFLALPRHIWDMSA